MSKIIDLTQISDYDKLLSIYEEQKDKASNEWLDFIALFDKSSKQGLVGLFKIRGTDRLCVFKLSKYMDYLCEHEYQIMNGFKSISKYCLHFCRVLGLIECHVDPAFRSRENPFKIRGKIALKTKVLLMEYLDKASKLYSYLKNPKISEDTIYSTVKQVLMAIAISQKKQFTHYDLHSYNVLMKRCNRECVFLYVLDEKTQFCVPSLGHYPVIIDYGFGYSEDCKNLWAGLSHTDIGFMSDRFDSLSDLKLFLVTIAGEIHEKRASHRSRKLKNIVKNIFKPLKIDWSSGWDKTNDLSATNMIVEHIKDYNDASKFFNEYDYLVLDIFQSLITLPLQPHSYKNLDSAYVTFIHEFSHIEDEISSSFYNLYILRRVLDSARKVESLYIKKESRSEALKIFRRDIFDTLSHVSKFCKVKNLHYEKLLCSIYVLARCIQGMLYDIMSARMAEKEKEYRKLSVTTPVQMYSVIEANIPHTYTYSSHTVIYVVDSLKEECRGFPLKSNEIEILNNIHTLKQGEYLYKVYKNK